MRVRISILVCNINSGDIMQIKEAIVLRFEDICKARNMAYNKLATISGVTPSTVYSMFDSRRKDLSVITVKKLLDGLGISIEEFFEHDIFLKFRTGNKINFLAQKKVCR